MINHRRTQLVGGAMLFALVACSAAKKESPLTGAGGSSDAGGAGGTGPAGPGGQGGAPPGTGGFDLAGSGGAGGGGVPCVQPGPDDDFDKDGFTITEGDCDDCDANISPNAIEAISAKGEPHDEDCDGQIDENDAVSCDDGLAVDDLDPIHGAAAAGICKLSKGEGDWGLVKAEWVLPDGSPLPVGQEEVFHLGHGVLTGFGPVMKLREGKRLLALSSGTARQPNDPGYKDVKGFSKDITFNHPQGFPKESPLCGFAITGEPHDGAALKVELRAPSNAHGIAFDFDFYSYEWPNFVCSMFNDFFVALLTPFPKGQADGNISFDSMGNPVSVNNAFVEVCGCDGNPPLPCIAGGKTFTCKLGDSELTGTGFGADSSFEAHGATSWLTSQAPIEPSGEKDSVITITWGVYDSGDGLLDSTTLVDRFRFIAKPGVSVNTVPAPD